MKKKGANFIRDNYQAFIDSFKRMKLSFFLVLFFDALFYFIFMQMGNFLIKILSQKAANVNLEQNILALNQQAAGSLLSSLRGFFAFLIFSIILFLILMIINWSLFKGIIWSIAANKKFTFQFFKKFLLLNLIWLPLWLFLALLRF